MPQSLRNKKNIIIYFDYEREFSGHQTQISDENIREILKELKDKEFRTTWFTVGKIFINHSRSIVEIMNNEHEIGSHTFAHYAPLDTPKKQLKADFRNFHTHSKPYCNILGFHSPRGQWSYSMLKLLKKFDFAYDIVGCRKNRKCKTILIPFGRKKSVLRFCTVGDDWPLYHSKYNNEKVLEYFMGLIDKIDLDDIAAIGFHPWVLFSDPEIFRGFKKFLQYLRTEENIRVETGFVYAKTVAY